MATQTDTEKYYIEKEKILRDEIEKKTGKSPEELYREREKSVRDSINLVEPDRVPVVMGGGFILTNGSSIDEAKPENIRAMVDSVKKYGLN